MEPINQNREKVSSYFATVPFGATVLVIAIICAYYNYTTLFGYLLFVTLLSWTACLWGHFSVNQITIDMQAQSRHAYPGQGITIAFTLKNDKCLPLMWLQWMQDLPVNGCLETPEDFQECQIANPALMRETVEIARDGKVIEEPEFLTKLCKQFSFIKWYATVTWESEFRAKCRGVYCPDEIEIHTGDGFGLSVSKKKYPVAEPPLFVVYPMRVPVSSQAFFKNAWSASTGPHGVIEDVTVLRGTRAYEKNDSFKRINWRLAAREEELNVNIYDTISPRSVYFFIDTTTFYGLDDNNAAFEQTLSVVGSLISELFELGMSVGLNLPVVAGVNLNVDVESATQEACLLSLALADCSRGDGQFSRTSIAQLLSTQSGNVYYVCHDAAKGRFTALFEETGLGNFAVIPYLEPTPQQYGGILAPELSIYPIPSFQKG